MSRAGLGSSYWKLWAASTGCSGSAVCPSGPLSVGVLARGFGLTAPFGFASASVAALILFVWRIISNRTVAEAQAPSS